MKRLSIFFLLKKESLLTVASVAWDIYQGLYSESTHVHYTDSCKPRTNDKWERVGVKSGKLSEVVLVNIVKEFVFYNFDWLEIFHYQEISFC